jgi:hypothetical protein
VIKEHLEAVAAMLAPLATPGLKVYSGDVTDDPPKWPYLVWRMTTGVGERTKVCGETDKKTFYVYVTSVGLSTTAAAIVADQVEGVLLDQRPTVAGRSCTRMEQETSIPIQADRDVTDPTTKTHPLYAVDTYTFLSWKD